MKTWYTKDDTLIKSIENQNDSSSGNSLFGWYIGQCGFIFSFQHKIYAIDPVLSDFTKNENGNSSLNYEPAFAPEKLKVDYVFCTHGHPDHFEVKTILGLISKNPKIKIIIPSGCLKLAKDHGIEDKNLFAVTPDSYALIDDEGNENISLYSASAAHPVHVYENDNPGMCLCYNIRFGNISVVHLGDTYLTKDLYRSLQKVQRIQKIDLFLPPINGDDFFKREANFIGNMEAEEAAKLAVALNAGLSIPTHYDMVKGNTADPSRFVKKLLEERADALYKLPQLGQGFII